ncbi:hypothetical protein [Anatilimnocola floriformis]|uniref:hypothetical protein n=1 Tax=Anatilimnocola floriformis TaxID=2948575 RepID=UPI0020C47B6B|nr:hypothetical protein [Anatilimnocola floriformis]
MPLTHFLQQLFHHSRVTVEAEGDIALDDPQLWALLEQHDLAWRQQLPRDLPPLDQTSALFGAMAIYRSAQVLVFRDTPVAGLQQSLHGPELAGAREQFSVDLCLRFLPDLVRLARARSHDDPLVRCLLDLGSCWPLSSVGIAGVELNELGKTRVTALAENPGVWQLYLDRVLQTGDESRLADPRVRLAARRAVGAFPQLAGKLSKSLEEPKEVPAA